MLQVQKHPYKGRCYTTTTNVQAGEYLLRLKPYVAVPDSESRERCCANCLRLLSNTPIQTFNHLEIVSYCSKECQTADRIFFDQENSFYSDVQSAEILPSVSGLSNYAKDYTRMLLRSLWRRYLELSGKSDWEDQASFDQVFLLCSNSKCFPQERVKEFCSVADILTSFIIHSCSSMSLDTFLPAINEDSELPRQEFIESKYLSTQYSLLWKKVLVLICKEECNSFGTYTFRFLGPKYERQPYGLALYPGAVFFNHSCLPNVCHITSETGEMTFFALRDLKAGEEAMICYVQPENTAQALNPESGKERRAGLKDHFFFDCDCERCDVEQKQDEVAFKRIQETSRSYVCKDSTCFGRYIPSDLLPRAPSSELDKIDSAKQLDPPKTSITWMCEACYTTN